METVTYILIIIAAISNAVMDTIKHHWSKSIFKDFRNFWFWWFHVLGWKWKYVDFDSGSRERVKWNILGIKINKPVQLTNAWHFFKMIMLLCLIATPITYEPVFEKWLGFYGGAFADYAIMGIAYNTTFSTFYHHTFIRKKKKL